MSEKEPLIITADQARVIQRKLHGMQRIFFISYGALLALFALNNLMDADGSLKLWLVQSVPLLIFIPGLMHERYRTYSWICFVILVYFTWSVVNSMSPLVRWQDIVVVVLSVIIFISAMMISRWMQYWQYYQRQQETVA